VRERREDIPLLVDLFLAPARRSPTAIRGWPDDFFGPRAAPRVAGNVRELRNAVERARALAQHPTLGFEAPPKRTASSAMVDIDVPFKVAKQKLVDEFDRKYLEACLEGARQQHLGRGARRRHRADVDLTKMIRRLGLDKTEARDGDSDDDDGSTDHHR